MPPRRCEMPKFHESPMWVQLAVGDNYQFTIKQLPNIYCDLRIYYQATTFPVTNHNQRCGGSISRYQSTINRPPNWCAALELPQTV